MIPVLIVVAVLVLLLLIFVFGGGMLVNVGGMQVGIVERRYFGRSLPEGRVVAMKNEIGVQARVLPPGLHLMWPFLYVVRKTDMLTVAEDEVGLVESIDGKPLDPGRIFARHVNGHDSFQDGEAFLTQRRPEGPADRHPAAGPSTASTLTCSPSAIRRRFLSRRGRSALSTRVTASRSGPGRLLAHKVEGHQAFQDGEAFLLNNGQRGPQIEVILPGRYRINTDLFNVDVQPATIVMANQVGLVTAKDGAPLPSGELVADSVEGHQDFQDASAFLASRRSARPAVRPAEAGHVLHQPAHVRREARRRSDRAARRGRRPRLERRQGAGGSATRGRGSQARSATSCRLGSAASRRRWRAPACTTSTAGRTSPTSFPTTNLTIDWAEETAIPADEDTGGSGVRRVQLFNPLAVISRDGFEMRVSVKVVIRVRPEQAPLMVAKIGSIENLIDHVVHPMIDSSFRNQASSSEAMNFMQDRAEEQAKADERTRVELEKYHVECVSVLISQIILPQELMEIHTRRVIAAQQQEMFIEQQKAEQERIGTENTRAKADKQIELVAAQIGVQIAEQTKQKTIIEAEGRARAVELEGEAEGKKILAIGKATAEAYEKQVDAVGQMNLAGIEVTKSIAGAGLKITPDIMVGGDGGGGGANVFTAFIAQLLSSNRAPLNGPTSTNGQEQPPKA